MRAGTILLAALFLSLVTLMSDTATADDKKEPPKKNPADPKSYDEKATVRKLNGKQWLNPVKDVPLYRTEFKGRTIFYTMPPAMNAETPKGSEITTADGAVFVVEQVVKFDTHHLNYVVPKPKDK